MAEGLKITEQHPRDVGELFALLDPSNRIWGCGRVPDWVFRGQSSDQPLLPSAWRPGVMEKPVWGKTMQLATTRATEWMETGWETLSGKYPFFSKSKPPAITEDEWQARVKELATRIWWEQLLIQRFADLADEIGLSIESGAVAAGPMQHLSRDPFGEHGASPEPSQVYAFAQHHGLPTRLLDWTRRAFHAAYFATEKLAKCSSSTGEAIIWALNIRNALDVSRKSNKNEREGARFLGVQIVHSRRAGHSFLHAQDGLFTWTHGWERHLLASGDLPSLDHALYDALSRAKLPNDGGLLQKIYIPAAVAKDVMTRLQSNRITLHHLMPTLDNVTRTMKTEYLLPVDPSVDAPSAHIHRNANMGAEAQ